MNVVLDTDVLLGIFNIDDQHHGVSVKLAKTAAVKGVNIFILPTTLSEFALLASSRIGRERTQKAVSSLMSDEFIFFDVTSETIGEAVRLYEKQSSKEESLFDCFVMIAAKHLNADCIFSFDKGYIKNGFKLLGER